MFLRARMTLILLVSALVLTAGRPSFAQTPEAEPFAPEIQAFRQWDTKNAVPRDGVLFVGSSTIRLWPTAERFPDLPVINRGFGGSQIFQVNRYVQELVVKHKPRVVVFYAGDNDINAGRTSDQVLDDYRKFVLAVLAARRDTTVIFLAIKPSLARWALWPKMQEANQRIKLWSEGFSSENRGTSRLMFLDLASEMLGPDGKPQPRFYVEDGLHMTAAGYDLWTSRLAPLLTAALGSAR